MRLSVYFLGIACAPAGCNHATTRRAVDFKTYELDIARGARLKPF